MHGPTWIFWANLTLFSLQHLHLESEEVVGDLGGLAPLSMLETLDLTGCTRVSGDVRGLAPLTRLEHLNLYDTRAAGDVKGLAPLLGLTRLLLWGTKVSGHVEGLAPLSELEQLDLFNTKVSGDVEGLVRARSHCRFVLPLIHFITDLLTYSVPLYI